MGQVISGNVKQYLAAVSMMGLTGLQKKECLLLSLFSSSTLY